MNFVLLLDGEKVLASTPNLPQPPEEILKGLKNLNDDLKRGLENLDKALGFQVEAPEGTRIVKLFPLISEEGRPMTLLVAEIPFCSPDDTLHILGRIMDNVNTICVAIDTKGTILHFNKGAEMAFGYSREEVLGRNWFNLFYENPSPEFIEKFTQISKKEMPAKNLSA
ncbi:MAG: hypothetical protein DRN42_05975, partial [Thermoplasmata archaeon]